MKKNVWMALASLMMFAAFTSCSKEDDEGDLIGTWKMTYAAGWIKENGVIIDEWDTGGEGWTVTFKEDGTWIDSEGEGGNWSLKKNTLAIQGDEEDLIDFKIVKLSSSELKLEQSYSEAEESNGKSYSYEYYNELTFKKV